MSALSTRGDCGCSKTKARESRRIASSVVFYEFSFVAGQGIVERLDKGIFIDEIACPLCPRRENFLLLHLLQRFVIVEGFLDHRGSFLQHLGERIAQGNKTKQEAGAAVLDISIHLQVAPANKSYDCSPY